jgi:hypothetical protein
MHDAFEIGFHERKGSSIGWTNVLEVLHSMLHAALMTGW